MKKTAILDLFIAATMPVLTVLLVTNVGSLLAACPLNIQNDEARKHLNSVGYTSFLSLSILCFHISFLWSMGAVCCLLNSKMIDAFPVFRIRIS